MTENTNCLNCKKPIALCVCASIEKISTHTKVLVLQHPQEPDVALGSGLLTHLSLPNSIMKIGLSWRSLEHAIGVTANPKDWIVLYLGSAKLNSASSPVVIVDKEGKAIPNSDSTLKDIKGLVVLDGTWSQAKTLWWRNAWLLKLRRAVLVPQAPSLYGKYRKEPRPDGLSTIESVALVLGVLEKEKSVSSKLLQPFEKLLSLYIPPVRAKRQGLRRWGRKSRSSKNRNRNISASK